MLSKLLEITGGDEERLQRLPQCTNPLYNSAIIQCSALILLSNSYAEKRNEGGLQTSHNKAEKPTALYKV